MSKPHRPRKGKGQPGSKRARTRERLIDAAFALFREKGIQSVGLEAVAASIGMTRGAVYGNFKNKDALVFEVAKKHLALSTGPFLRSGAPIDEQMRLLAEALMAVSPAVIERITLIDEFYGYALSRPAVLKRVTELQRQRIDAAVAHFLENLDEAQLILPAPQFVVLVNAVFLGLMHHRAMFPDLVNDKMIYALFDALVRKN